MTHKLWMDVTVAILIWLSTEFGDDVATIIVSLIEGMAHG